ncbi:class I SAM-dependent methyltransferase [Shewanella fodinae]|uniref:class I SAM-dependent methyltransferase n=1 Tax=Shewanella fodinae TaxID=552357 RepID=UPI001678325B|nr:class I SAM-dependent methyltransferase [Shewanella fodinae]MCL2906687.1 class I SAM-dependent methyltransferase [Shewanella fodinae]
MPLTLLYPRHHLNAPVTTVYFDQNQPQLGELLAPYPLLFDAGAPFEMKLIDGKLNLLKRDEPKLGGVHVDFTSGAVAHRRKYGGGRGQEIAKAAGLKQGACPTILDSTAGLGRDAFVLASLGCRVWLIERHPMVAALLADGLSRAYADEEIGSWMQQRMQLLPWGTELTNINPQQLPIDVVYLDPMYPHRDNSAQVKKEMRVFQHLVGADDDAAQLLQPALTLASKRVVVKRPDYAENLDNTPPTLVIAMKKNRFDVYVKAARPNETSSRLVK